jgi:RNA polymerase sigma factor (sigma-70 family)
VIAVAVLAIITTSGAGPTAVGAGAPTVAASATVGDAPALPTFTGTATDPAVGRAIPEARGTDFEGSSVAIEHDGRPKVLLFVAHWCPHCQAEVPVVQAWLALPRRRPEARFEPWLLAIAWNVALDFLKRTRRAAARDRAWHAVSEVEDPPAGTARIEVERALARLSVDERAALVLTAGHGWSQSEAAGILDMRLGTLKSAALRAKGHR